MAYMGEEEVASACDLSYSRRAHRCLLYAGGRSVRLGRHELGPIELVSISASLVRGGEAGEGLVMRSCPLFWSGRRAGGSVS